MFSKEFLEREYVTNNKSSKEIAREFGGSSAQVLRDIHRHTINPHPVSNKGVGFKESHRKNLSRAQRGKQLGSKNPNWKGGLDLINLAERRSAQYVTWRREMLRDFGDKCQQCGRDLLTPCPCCGRNNDRHVHHIKPFSDNPELRYSLENGMVLCESCHRLLKTGLIRRISQEDNAEPAGEIAKGSPGVCDGQR